MSDYSPVWTTAQAATRFKVKPGSFARFARAHGVEPICRVRVGSSTLTLWSIHDLAVVARELSGVSGGRGVCAERSGVVK